MSTSLKCGFRVLSIAALAFVLYLGFTNQSDARFYASTSGQEQSKSAEQLIAEADRISSSDASDSLNKAVELLTRALELYRTARNPGGEALVLHKLAIAYDSLGNKERALKAGARAFVQKPWNDAELLAIIAELTADPIPLASHPN